MRGKPWLRSLQAFLLAMEELWNFELRYHNFRTFESMGKDGGNMLINFIKMKHKVVPHT